MRVSPGLGSAVLFAASFLGVVLCGTVLPMSSEGSPQLKPWMLDGLLVCGAVAVLSAPFGWRGFLNWRSHRTK